MGTHSEKHHLPAGAWAPQHGQLVAEELARGSTWLLVGQQHPMSVEPVLSSACCPSRAVALFWGGLDGTQHTQVSAHCRDGDLRAQAAELALWKMRGSDKACAGLCWQSSDNLI